MYPIFKRGCAGSAIENYCIISLDICKSNCKNKRSKEVPFILIKITITKPIFLQGYSMLSNDAML